MQSFKLRSGNRNEIQSPEFELFAGRIQWHFKTIKTLYTVVKCIHEDNRDSHQFKSGEQQR